LGLPDIDHLLNIFDFEHLAQKVMKKEAWDYYSSGAGKKEKEREERKKERERKRERERDKQRKEQKKQTQTNTDDEITLRENHSAFQRIWLRPRVMVDVTKVNFETTMLGNSNKQRKKEIMNEFNKTNKNHIKHDIKQINTTNKHYIHNILTTNMIENKQT